MRCKNCGSENDDNLYICQNCGSPLYDEDDENETVKEDDMGKTRVAPVVQSNQRPASNQPPHNNKDNKNDNKNNNKSKEKTLIIIVVLAVVLALVVTIIASVLISNSKKNNDVEDTSFSTTLAPTTESTTLAPTTAPTTTPTTTETTTQSTTQVTEYTVTASCSQGGEVEGDGVYAQGEKCTVIARADDEYEFDGWYKNGKRVSSNEAYTFTVNGDTELEAVFTFITDVTEVDE